MIDQAESAGQSIPEGGRNASTCHALSLLVIRAFLRQDLSTG
jgi:hypothetical protein